MLKEEGMAGAAQYEEAYAGSNNIRGSHSMMGAQGNTGPRKMNYGGNSSGQR